MNTGKGGLKKGKNVTDIAFDALEDNFGVTKRQTKSWGKRAVRYFKLGLWMAASGIAIPLVLIPLGILLGPGGWEGLVLTPVAVVAAWALILFIGLKRRATPEKIARAPLREISAQLTEYLEASRRHLPPTLKGTLESILQRLEELTPALHILEEESPVTARLRKLLTQDLTALIDHYRRLPPRLRTQSLLGGPTPEAQLASGLGNIRDELGRVHEELAKDDLYALAIKERYLEMKYGSEIKR